MRQPWSPCRASRSRWRSTVGSARRMPTRRRRRTSKAPVPTARKLPPVAACQIDCLPSEVRQHVGEYGVDGQRVGGVVGSGARRLRDALEAGQVGVRSVGDREDAYAALLCQVPQLADQTVEVGVVRVLIATIRHDDDRADRLRTRGLTKLFGRLPGDRVQRCTAGRDELLDAIAQLLPLLAERLDGEVL